MGIEKCVWKGIREINLKLNKKICGENKLYEGFDPTNIMKYCGDEFCDGYKGLDQCMTYMVKDAKETK